MCGGSCTPFWKIIIRSFSDTIWYIHTDEEIRIRRLMENRGYTREKSVSIIASQAPETFFRENADYVVVNNGDFAQTDGRLRKESENMRLCSIASGSSGNCIYVGSDNTHLLVDVGISGKRVEQGLNSLELTGKDIDGILITHEHSDHIKGLGVIARKHQIPV